MATTLAFLVAGIVLLFAGRDTAFVEPLTPVWSKPLGKGVQLVGVEEYGRCILFADHGAIDVVLPSGDTAWSWPYSKISRYINPREVAVSHDCDAIALVGDASYKYAWIVPRVGKAVRLAFTATPADVEFDRTGTCVAIGTYAGSMSLYSVGGPLQWTRDTGVTIVDHLEFTADNQHIAFKGWAGSGIVSAAGQVESSEASPHDSMLADEFGDEVQVLARSEDGALAWVLRRDGSVDCVNDAAEVLVSIATVTRRESVKVSRNFSQVLIVREKDLTPVAVDLYVVPDECKMKNAK